MPPPGLDLNNVENLTPAPQADLYFGGAHSDDNATSTVAKVGLGFQHPSVVLDHTNYIKSVHCDSSSITIVFNELSAFQHSESEWQMDGHVILVTSEDSCGANVTSTMFLTESFTFDTTNLIAVGKGQEAHLADIYDTLDLDFGVVTTSNTSYTPNCGTMNGTDGTFPSAACGTSFDSTLDQELGYYTGDDDSIIAIVAPTSQTTLNKRWSLKGAISKVTSVAKAIAAPVAKAAAAVVPASIQKAASSLGSTLKSAVSAVASLVPAVTLSKSLDVPLNLGPAQNDPSPWGPQYKFFEYSPDSKKDASMIAATQKSLSGMSTSLNGISDPKPGIQMYCVDCGIKGQFQAVGTVSASLAKGVTRCDVSLDGNLYAGVFVGVNAFAAYEKNINKDLINKGLPTLSIPGIAVLGPKVTISLNSHLKVQAAGQLLVGASLNWPKIHANLDLLDKSKSVQTGFTPEIVKKFDAWGDVTADASLALPVTLFFGVDILNGKYQKGVSLVNTPAVTASAELAIAASYGTGASNGITSSTGCFGIKYNIGLSNNLAVHLLDINTLTLLDYQRPTLAGGCLGRAVPTVKRTTSSSAAPTSTDDGSDGSAATDGPTPTDGVGSGSSDGSDNGGSSASTTADSGDSPAPTDAGSQPTTTDAGSQPTTTDAGSQPNTTIAGSAQTTTDAGNAGSAQTSTAVSVAQTSTTSVVAPTPSALKCGDYYTTSDGTYWQVQCGFDWPGRDIMHTPYPNMSSCIDACSDYGSACAGVIWVQRGQDAQNCWLKSSTPVKGSIPSGLTLFAASPVTYAPLISCPAADGTTFVDAQKQVYGIKCNMDYQGYDLGGLTGYNSLESCINYCDTNLDCIGVSYAYSGTYKTPLCYPKYEITDMPLNATKFKYKVDTAVKMNRPQKKALGSCPSIDGSTFYDAAGKYYKISCGLDFQGNDIVEKDNIATLEQCINACDANNGCTGVSFAHDGYYGNNPGCYLKSAQSSNAVNSTTDLSYIVDSAYLVSGSMKKRNVVSVNARAASSSTSSVSSSSSSVFSSRSSTLSASSTSVSSAASTTFSTSSLSSSASIKASVSSAVSSTKSSSLSSSMTSSSTSSSASSSATATADNTTNIIITDTSGQLQLTPSGDGNMYMSPNASNASFGSDGYVALGDAAGNLFVYYPDMLAAHGASRFRLAAWGSIPHGARLLTLTPFKSGDVTALLAVDTLGHFFFPVLCSFEGAQQAKVFLVKDPTADLSFIADPELRFILTGGVVSQCNPLALTSKSLKALA